MLHRLKQKFKIRKDLKLRHWINSYVNFAGCGGLCLTVKLHQEGSASNGPIPPVKIFLLHSCGFFLAQVLNSFFLIEKIIN